MRKLVVNTHDKKSVINKNIYGHFSEHLGRCIYNGIYVGEDSEIPNRRGMRTDVVQALRNIRIPVLRWPGGCFADEYHWKDGIGPKSARKKMINTHWGGVVEDNSFGTHEFMELCSQLDCEPYINGNVGSGTVQEMSEWVEYLTFDGTSPMAALRTGNGREKPWRVQYWGVGNENWGCGGNMRPEYYADLYRRFQTYVRNYGDNRIFRIACGANAADYDWTDKVMAIAAPFMDAITLHYYTVPGEDWEHKGSAADFSKEDYYRTIERCLKMEELIDHHTQIMNRYDPAHRVGLIVDEWGNWFDVEPGTNPGFLYQQNTMRDALTAAATLNIFNRHSDRVVMANLAQTVNVLQSVILTEGGKMVLTPTYHVFDLYKNHQNAALLYSYVENETITVGGVSCPQLSCSASQAEDGSILITAANFSLEANAPLSCSLEGKEARRVSAKILSGSVDSYNSFENPEAVKPAEFTGVQITDGGLTFVLPPCSVLAVTVE